MGFYISLIEIKMGTRIRDRQLWPFMKNNPNMKILPSTGDCHDSVMLQFLYIQTNQKSGTKNKIYILMLKSFNIIFE